MLGTPSVGHGQVLLGILFGDKLVSERFHIGLNVGANVSNLGGVSGTEVKTGLMLGLVAEWRIGGSFYLQPELLPFYKVGAGNIPPRQGLPPLVDTLVTDRSSQRSVSYFAIPVILKYAVLDHRLFLGAGPQVNFLTSAWDTYSGVINKEIDITDDVQDRLESTDAGVAFQVEYKLSRQVTAASINVRYYLGLTDTIKDNTGSAVTNQVLSIFGSVPIGGDPAADDE
jgi:hypothetical protein